MMLSMLSDPVVSRFSMDTLNKNKFNARILILLYNPA